MSTQDIVIIGATLVGPVLPSLALWLRPYLRLHGVRERRLLRTAAAALPPGSQIQVHRSDGTQVVLIVGGGRRPGEQR